MVTSTTTRTDEQIQRDVLEEMKWDARVQPNEIGVAVKDGVVTLTPEVALEDSRPVEGGSCSAPRHPSGLGRFTATTTWLRRRLAPATTNMPLSKHQLVPVRPASDPSVAPK